MTDQLLNVEDAGYSCLDLVLGEVVMGKQSSVVTCIAPELAHL